MTSRVLAFCRQGWNDFSIFQQDIMPQANPTNHVTEMRSYYAYHAPEHEIEMDMFMLSGNVPSGALISLGTLYGEKYYVSDDCLQYLNDILSKLDSEDKGSRNFRRSLSFMDIISKDLVPIVTYVKDQPLIYRTTIKLLVDLTSPVDSLVPTELLGKIPQGMHVLYDLNNLLYNTKESFIKSRPIKALMEYFGSISYNMKCLSSDDGEAINDVLMLIRNILNIPERPHYATGGMPTPDPTACEFKSSGTSEGSSYGSSNLGASEPQVGFSASDCYSFTGRTALQRPSVGNQQNQLVWNLFASGLDRILIQLMSDDRRETWSVTMVQLVALLYKDQHVDHLQKLLATWVDEDASSGSSDDESNTSPPCNSVQNPDSDSLSSSISACNHADIADLSQHSSNNLTSSPKEQVLSPSSSEEDSKPASPPNGSRLSVSKGIGSKMAAARWQKSAETTESGSDGEMRRLKRRPGSNRMVKNTRTTEDMCRRKIIKRGKVSRTRMKALLQHKPTESEVSNLLRDFTVDFLLKGYGNLVGDLHDQIIGQLCVTMDKSHMMWLITYFLRFATQLKMDVTRLWPVLSPGMLAYLIAESVNVNEELELVAHSPKKNIKPYLRRLHLSVSALREFMQALNSYSKTPCQNDGDKSQMEELKGLVPQIADLRNLLLLLIRHYNPLVQSKKYLRDVIVTNHIVLKSLDRTTSEPGYVGQFKLVDHLKLFCTPSVLRQYGLCLEDYAVNEPKVNDAVMTLLHHVAGDLGCPELLFDPIILKTFVRLFEDDFEVAEEWTDLVEYVTRTFLRCVNAGSLKSTPAHSCRNRSKNGSGSQSDRSTTSCSSAKPTQGTLGQKPMEEEEMGSDSSHMSPNEEEPVPDIIARLNDAGMNQEIQWLQRCLLIFCAAKLTNTKKEKRKLYSEPIAMIANETKCSMPMVPFTEEQEAALRCLPFLRLIRCLGLDPPLVPTRIFPQIPYSWDADTAYSVALQLGPVHGDNLLFRLNQVRQVPLPPPSMTEIVPPSNSYGCPTGSTANLSCAPDQWMHMLDCKKTAGNVESRTSSGKAFQDSASNTSSLEVHKTDTSDSEMDAGRLSPDLKLETPMDVSLN